MRQLWAGTPAVLRYSQPRAVCIVQAGIWDQGCLVTDCKCWNPPEKVLFSEEEDRRGMDFLLSCTVCSNHPAQSIVTRLSDRRGMVSCMQERNSHCEAWRGEKAFVCVSKFPHTLECHEMV